MVKDAKVSDDEIKSYYDENKDNYKREPGADAYNILVDSEEKCAEILAMINAGEKTFEDAAKEFSTCPSGQRDGDLGALGKGQMVPEFEKAAFEAEVGQIVGPVMTQFGAHLIKVEAKNEAETASFAEVSGQIRQHLLQQKQNKVYTDALESLKEKYIQK